MKDLAFRGLPQQAISEFATSPNPGSPCFAWSTDAGFLKFNGSFWTKNTDGSEEILVDWIFAGDSLVTELVNETSLTINFSTSITALAGSPVTGQIIWLITSTDITKSGFYVIGSTASPSAVPITRHPEWPSSRYLRKNTKIVSYRAPVFRFTGGNFDIDDTSCSVANDTIVAGFLKLIYKDYAVYKLTLDSGATAPGGITPGTYYWGYSDPLNPTSKIQLYTDSTFATLVNITSVGVNGGSGKIGVLKAIGAFPNPSRLELKYIGDDVKFQDVTFFNFLPNYSEQIYSTSISGGYSFTSGCAIGGVAFDNAITINGFAESNSIALSSSCFADNSVSIGYNSYVNDSYINKNSANCTLIGANGSVSGIYSMGIGANVKVKSSNTLQMVTSRITVPSATLGFNINGNYHFENRTTNATETRLYIYLNDTTEELQIFEGGYTVSGKIYAVFSSDTTKYTIWKVEGFIEGKGAATPPVINLKFIPLNSSGGANELSLKIRAAVVGNSFTLYATGIAATNIWWWADLQIDGTDTSQGLAVSIPFAGGKHTTDYLWLPASEAITAGAPVNIWNDTGTVKVRNANASNGRAANGYVTMTYGTGDMVAVFLGGENPVLSGLTVGDIYLGTSAGTYTSSVPGTGNLVQKLGFAISSSNLAFMKEPAIQT